MESKHIKQLNKLLTNLQNEQNPEVHRRLKLELVWYIELYVAPEDGCEVIGKWLLPVLAQNQLHPIDDQLPALMAWISSIFEKNINIDNSVFSLITMLIPKVKKATDILWIFSSLRLERKEYVLPALQCFDAILTKMLQENDFVSEEVQVFDLLTKTLLAMHYKSEPRDVPTNAVFLLSSLSVLTKICTLDTRAAQMHVSELLGLSQAYLLYGLSTTAKILPHKILPSQQAVPMDTAEELAASTAAKGVQAQKHGGLLQKKRKPKAVKRPLPVTQHDAAEQRELLLLLEQSFSDLQTSDSELSGNELSAASQQQRQLSSKVRLAAISLLGSVLRALERRQIYGFWHVLFPTQMQSENRSDLLYVSQHDPHVRCRIAALQISARLIFEAKTLLSQAEISSSAAANMTTTSYMPFSQSLGLLLIASYEALCQILAKEASNAVLTQALKSLAMLVQATPFKRIKSNGNLVASFVQHVRPLVYNRNNNVQLAALMVMEFLLLTPDLTAEIAEAIGYKKVQEVELDEVDEEEAAEFEIENDMETTETETATTTTTTTTVYSHTSWLLLRVLANLERLNYNPLLVQNYKVLNAMSTHFELLLPQLPRLAHLFERVLSNNVDYAIHVAQCLNSCTHHMNLWLSTKTDTHTHTCLNFWLQLLPVLENTLSQRQAEEETAVMLINALSNVGPIVYEKLPQAAQMKLLCCLTNYGSADVNIAAAAIRALAIYANYPALRADFVFIENTLELALRLVQSPSVLIRSKSFWALSSISDALVAQTESGSCLSEQLFRRYMQCSVEAAKETNDKINCSAAHILGNLLSLVQEQQLRDTSWLQILQLACSRICSLTCAGTAKTRWNACYALGIMWRNKLLFSKELLPYQFEIYEALCSVITNHANFKVRINASSALQQISERVHLGAYFERLWNTLLIALEQSHNLENFYEYNHRDKLQEQLCLSICQLLKLAEPEDMPGMRQSLEERLEVVHNTWLRVTNRLVPELAVPLMASSTIVLQKLKPHAINNTLKNAIEFIAQAFDTNSKHDLNHI